MKIAIHQPEHFPYMGFFQKMNACDLFVILDNVKYRKNYFQNRNKFINKSGNEEWFTVPVEKKAHSKLIKDVYTSKDTTWRKKIVKKIEQNMGVTTSEIYDSEKILDINLRSIKWCMEKLYIKKKMILASHLSVSGNKSELLANIVRKLGSNHYVSGPSGKNYLELEYFDGINVEFFVPDVKNHYSMLYNICKK